MAFDEALAERIRQRLARKKGIEEKKMFGGIGFLLNGNMLVGVWKDSLLVRLGDAAEILVRLPGDGAVSALGWNATGSQLLFGLESGAAGLLSLPA